MFNKLKFNNLVISNQKGIQQSRIQTINKLVHKIRKLKTLSEKHPDNTKCKERIRKSTETMEILKKLKRVDIMKKLLLMDKPAAAIITNGISIPEEIAVALLSMNKVMQSLIKRFKTELRISELEGDDWKQVLMESSKRERKIERTEQKRRKRLEIKQQKAMGKKRQEWLEENQPKMDSESLSIEADANISTIRGWQIEELSKNTVPENDKGDVKNPTKELKGNVTKSSLVSKRKQKIVKTEQINIPENNPIEERKDIKQPNRVSSNFTNVNTDSNEKEEENEDSLVVDQFFITDTGENYLSTAVNKKENISEEDDGFEKRDLHMIKLNKICRNHLEFKESRNQRRQQNGNKWESGDVQNKPSINKYNRNDKFSRNQLTDKNNAPRRQQNYYKKDFTNENILHPSWAAKQKHRPIITDFKGKKTKFDDNLSNTNIHPENDIKIQKPASIKSNHSEKDSLHPSWAAKQKLKPSITTFQGKKIIFDNDE